MLKEIFVALANKYAGDPVTAEQLWTDLEKHYTRRDRHYHNLSHLEYMYRQLEKVPDIINDWDTLLFSLFYHDIIYKATAKDNEEKSAKAAVKALKMLVYPEEKTAKCEAQILATKTHASSPDNDTNLLTDADLSILGSTWESYQNYAKQVRKEYAIYPDFLYNPGRRKALQHFLDMDHIFKTSFFREWFEENARKNLMQELAQLQ